MLPIIIISCLGILVYSNTFLGSFHFDDYLFITSNPAIKNIHQLSNIWHYWHCRFFVFLSLALNYHFNGLNVFGYHLFNLVVHLLSAILVWWLTLLTLSTPALKENKITQQANLLALLAGLVFVSHPLQTEAVTYIWQRSASMAALFYLASLCFYIRSRLPPQHRVLRWFSLITAMVAMFTRESAVTLPLMMLAYEFTFLRTRRNFDWKPLVPFLFTLFIIPVTFLYSSSDIFQNHHGDLQRPDGVITPMHYFLTQFRAMLTYIRLAFLPFHQNLDYDYPLFKNIFEWPVLSSFLFLIVIFYFTKHLFFKYRLLSFSIFWFFFTLTVPESSFWAMGDLVSEHRLYLPLAGYSIFLVCSVYYLLGKESTKTMVIVLSLIITCYAVLTYQRNEIWKNDVTLWDDAVKKSPHKLRPHMSRGSAYYWQGDLNLAMSDFDKAIDINPNDVDLYIDRADTYYRQGKLTDAIMDLNKAITIDPNREELYFNRGKFYAEIGNEIQAVLDFSKAIAINPNRKESYINRGNCYAKLGNEDQAMLDYNRTTSTPGVEVVDKNP